MKQLLVIILCALCIFSIAFADTMLNPFTGKMDFVGAAGDPVAVNWDDLEDVINDAAINWTAVKEIGDDNINWTDIPNITIAGTMTADSFVVGDGTDSNQTIATVNRASTDATFGWDDTNDAFTMNYPLIVGGSSNQISFDNDETIDNANDGYIEFQGVGGTDNTDIRIDLDGTYPIFDSPTDTSIGFADALVTVGITDTGVNNFGGATSFEIPNSADPNVDALGEISYDSDDFAIRAYDGTNQIAVGQKNHQISKTLYKPNDMSNNGLIVLWRNISGFIYNITRIFAGSETANVEFSIFKVTGTSTGVNWESVTEIEPIVLDTTVLGDNGINWSTSNLTSGINWTTINSEDSIGINWSSSSDPDWVNLEIQGWYNADVN